MLVASSLLNSSSSNNSRLSIRAKSLVVELPYRQAIMLQLPMEADLDLVCHPNKAHRTDTAAVHLEALHLMEHHLSLPDPRHLHRLTSKIHIKARLHRLDNGEPIRMHRRQPRLRSSTHSNQVIIRAKGLVDLLLHRVRDRKTDWNRRKRCSSCSLVCRLRTVGSNSNSSSTNQVPMASLHLQVYHLTSPPSWLVPELGQIQALTRAPT